MLIFSSGAQCSAGKGAQAACPLGYPPSPAEVGRETASVSSDSLLSLSYFVSGFCSLKNKSLHPLLPQLNVDTVASVWIANPFCVS